MAGRRVSPRELTPTSRPFAPGSPPAIVDRVFDLQARHLHAYGYAELVDTERVGAPR